MGYEKKWQDQEEGILGVPLPRLLETAGLWNLFHEVGQLCAESR